MKAFLRFLLQKLRYPLMGVMLLWSLTRPGQELDVYRFLLACTSRVSFVEITNDVTTEADEASTYPEAVHAYEEAHLGSSVSLPTLLGLPPAALRLLFTYQFSEGFLGYFKLGALVRLGIKSLFNSVQPNAP